MGFCLFSSVAVGARAAQAAGLGRVAVVDFDVHHGNGTQAAFEKDPSLFFASVHQSPLYPGTGDEGEHGVGNVINATVPPSAPRELWRKRFESLMEGVEAFAPDLIMISGRFRRPCPRPPGAAAAGGGGFRPGPHGRSSLSHGLHPRAVLSRL